MITKVRGQVPDSTKTLAAPRKVRSYVQLVFDQFLRNRIAVAGAVVLLTVILLVLIGPLFIEQDAFSMNLGDRLLPASWDHPLGTDLLGRDMLERLILGGRVSLLSPNQNAGIDAPMSASTIVM